MGMMFRKKMMTIKSKDVHILKVDPAWGRHDHYSEAGQAYGVLMTWVRKEKKDTYRMQHAPILCRDYFCDTIHALWSKRQFRVWGFGWDPEVQQIDTDKLRLLIQVYSPEHGQNLFKNLPVILEDLDRINGFEPSVIHSIPSMSKEFGLLIEADPRWQETSLGISLYTLAIRAAAQYLKHPADFCWQKELDGEDAVFVKSAKKKAIFKVYHKFLDMCHKHNIPPCGHPKTHRPDAIHNYQGILAWCDKGEYGTHDRAILPEYYKLFNELMKNAA